MNREKIQHIIDESGFGKKIYLSNSDYGDPEFSTQSVGEDKEFVVKYFDRQKVIIIWNYGYRRKNNYPLSKLSYPEKDWNKITTGANVYHVRYKNVMKRNSGIFDKICMVGANLCEEVINNIDFYMMPNPLDEDYPQKNTYQINEILPENMRERYSSSRLKRDSKFREEVLEAYENKCAICRISLEEVLQAAHEHGYEPGKTSYDDPRHGICLCANHHLMYDKDLFSINLQNRQLQNVSEKVKEMRWFSEFESKYNGKLLERKQ